MASISDPIFTNKYEARSSNVKFFFPFQTSFYFSGEIINNRSIIFPYLGLSTYMDSIHILFSLLRTKNKNHFCVFFSFCLSSSRLSESKVHRMTDAQSEFSVKCGQFVKNYLYIRPPDGLHHKTFILNCDSLLMSFLQDFYDLLVFLHLFLS